MVNYPERLDATESGVYQIVLTFLESRLNTSEAIEWALGLDSNRNAERLALLNLLGVAAGTSLTEPWSSTWRLIEESWASEPRSREDIMQVYDVARRLNRGDRSGSVLDRIVDLVRPRLHVKPLGKVRASMRRGRRRYKRFDDLISASLTSGELVDLQVLDLASIQETDFLRNLATALDAAVEQGLDISRRIEPERAHSGWRQGQLNRAHYEPMSGAPLHGEPDAFHRGIAPCVKLLHAVVQRLGELDANPAQSILNRWAGDERNVRLRLWAASALNSRLVHIEDVTTFLQRLDNSTFWNLHAFPEVAELRASRFNEFDEDVKAALCERIVKKPPRSFWPRLIDADFVTSARRYWAIRELQRIRAYGHALPASFEQRLADSLASFPDLVAMDVSGGLPGGITISASVPASGEEFDRLDGPTRLTAIEMALKSPGEIWDDSPARRARDWLSAPANARALIRDMESSSDIEVPNIWERFGWTASLNVFSGLQGANVDEETERTLTLMMRLSDATLHKALRGICHWLYDWASLVVRSAHGLPVWERLWPIAVANINGQASAQYADLDEGEKAVADAGNGELDVLNSAVGKLVEVFFAALRERGAEQSSFGAMDQVRVMRDEITAAKGRAGLVARYRCTELLPYFLSTDEEWAERELIAPLLGASSEAIALWEAVARRTQHYTVLARIGREMAEKVLDSKLSRDAKRSFIFSLVVDALHGYLEARPTSVEKAVLTQILRALDDDIRAHAAKAVQQFVEGMSKPVDNEKGAEKAASVSRRAAIPFVREIWPQERSLATPGVSRELAGLPAASGDAFTDALRAVERFIVPFDCWSMIDFGLYGDFEGKKRLALIDSIGKAEAFLRLLDLAIGTSETAVIPNDLADALQQIRSISPSLGERSEFRRLSTAARR
ncbi:hypothetical protein SAMN05446935_7494 [Burkholderia sp. YR290]|nr:hypothetical protein SAMN05446935_7494 [Burkholderia sp. YR290]